MGKVLEVLDHDDADDDEKKEDYFSVVQNPLIQPPLERSELQRDISFCVPHRLCCVSSIKARQAKQGGHSKGDTATLRVTEPQPNPGDRGFFA